MSRDITLSYDKDKELDINIVSGDLGLSENLVNRILISLFTWAAPKSDDIIPDGIEPGGYWGDDVQSFPDDVPESIGSRLWLLDGKLTDETVKAAISYVKESIKWMDSETDIAEYNISAERVGTDQLDLGIEIILTDGAIKNMKFADVLNWGK